MKNALVIRHVAFEDLGSLNPILKQQGYKVNYVEAGINNLSEIDPLTPDILVVLGGPIGVYEDEEYPFLLDEVQMLQSRLLADKPTLGICLGAQLMARSLGAKVYPGEYPEIGWSRLELTTTGQRSPLAELVKYNTNVLHWHGDTFDLPRGTTHLASTPEYENQAFAWGRCSLALQFHPEVTQSNLESWLIGHVHEIKANPDITVAGLRQAIANYAPKLEKQAALFWQAWLELVNSSEPQLIKSR
jgi:GMP synthase (glutamine-hydrolysing)